MNLNDITTPADLLRLNEQQNDEHSDEDTIAIMDEELLQTVLAAGPVIGLNIVQLVCQKLTQMRGLTFGLI